MNIYKLLFWRFFRTTYNIYKRIHNFSFYYLFKVNFSQISLCIEILSLATNPTLRKSSDELIITFLFRYIFCCTPLYVVGRYTYQKLLFLKYRFLRSCGRPICPGHLWRNDWGQGSRE